MKSVGKESAIKAIQGIYGKVDSPDKLQAYALVLIAVSLGEIAEEISNKKDSQ